MNFFMLKNKKVDVIVCYTFILLDFLKFNYQQVFKVDFVKYVFLKLYMK